MIESVYIRAFKSFLEDEILLGQLTVLTGLNSSGKSSVIHALRMLKNVSEGKRKHEILISGHGDFKELVNIRAMDEDFKLEATIGDEGDTLWLDSKNAGGNAILPEMVYIGADRFGPQVFVPVKTDDSIGEHGENMFKVLQSIEDEDTPLSLRLDDAEKITVEKNIEAWLGKIAPGVILDYEIPKNTDASFSRFNGFRSANVGFGLSYILPILVALIWGAMKPGRLVMIENPEAHLHPQGQVAMGDLICRAVASGAQVILETHSDHLFDGIRIFTKNNKGFCEKIETYWFELDENRVTNIKNPKIEPDGKIKSWPKGMFDQFAINAHQLL